MSVLNMLEGMEPKDFGLDEFASFRTHPVTYDPVQLEVIEHGCYSDARVPVAAAPVGMGKSLIAVAIAKLTGLRTAIVVPFKGLQKQYNDELSRHLQDIRGRANYDCKDYGALDCKGGASVGCRYANGGGCDYEIERDLAREADIVLTNYDYWLTVNDHGGGIQRQGEHAAREGANPIEQLILDEGDVAEEKVADYLAVRLSEKEIDRIAESYGVHARDLGDDVETWKAFAVYAMPMIEVRINEVAESFKARGGKSLTKRDLDKMHKLVRLFEKFERIASMQDDWVIESRIGGEYGRVWNFDVISAGRYTERYLFCGIPKIVIMSGTITTKHLARLGLGRKDYDYRQWTRIFPAQKMPVYKCSPKRADGTSIKIDNKTTHEDLLIWIEHMDKWIDRRLDRKGIIITTSYKWADFVMRWSRHGQVMLGNKSRSDDENAETAEEFAEEFYKLSAPAILVSPSFSRGWNFKYDLAEYCIIPKCPFVPMNKIMQARKEKDKLYANLLVIDKVQQIDGRLKRAADDSGETLLCDGHFDYFLWQNRALAQDWWYSGIRSVDELPEPLEKWRART